MKKLSLLVIALITLSTAASAQFMNSGSTNTATAHPSVAVGDGNAQSFLSAFSVSYIKPSLTNDDGDSEDMDGGFGIAIEKAKSISTTAPLYLGYGIGVNYLYNNETDKSGIKTKMSFISAKVPVNVMYDFAIPGTEFNILPYAGVNAYYHISGQTKATYEGESEKVNMFDEDEFGIKLNRFNLGWTIGAKALFKTWYFGINFESPIVYLADEDGVKEGIKQTAFTIGFIL